MDERLQKIYDSVLNGEMDEAAAHVQAALDAQLDPGIILNESMISAMQDRDDHGAIHRGNSTMQAFAVFRGVG